MQRKDLTDAHLNSAFWAILVASGLLTVVSFVLAPWWADVNDLPELAKVVRVLSLMVPLRAALMVHEAILRRAMDFRSLAIQMNVAVTTAGAVAVALAFAGAGVWALVAQQLINAGMALLLVWKLCSWRPRFAFSRDAFVDLFGFSIRSFAATVAVFIGNRSDALLIGLFFGAEAVGLYYFASRLITMATDLTARALQSASLPELSRYQDDLPMFRDRTLSIIGLSGLLTIPLLGVVAASSDAIIAVLGNDQWGPAADVLRILTLVGAVRAITMITGPMLQSLGRPGYLAKLSWASAVLSAGTFVAVGLVMSESDLETQVVVLALSRVAVHVVFIFIYLFPLRSLLGVSWAESARQIAPVVAIAVLGFAVGTTVNRLAEGLPAFVQLVIVSASAGLAMLLLLLRFDERVQSAAVTGRKMLQRT